MVNTIDVSMLNSILAHGQASCKPANTARRWERDTVFSIVARLVLPIARQQSFFIGRYTIILLHLVGTVSFVEFVSSVGATRCGDPPALFQVAVGNVFGI